ncbi:MAG: HDOD domain-containing protein [Thermodesulfobacteriota bacterium]
MSEQDKNREISLDQQIAFLKRIAFFADFDDHELRQFLAVSRWLKVPADTLVIREDSRERVFYILVRGEVSVFKQGGDGQPATELTRLGTGDCFGEMSLVTDVRRTAGVRTTAPCYLLMVEPDIINSSNIFLQLKFYKRFCEVLVARLILANQKMSGQQGEAVEEAGHEPAVPDDGPAPVQAKPPPAGPAPPVPVPPLVQAAGDDLPPMPKEEDRLTRTKVQRLAAAYGERVMPVTPAVRMQVRGFLSREGGSTRKLAELISLDPVLALKVLQVANSSFYRRSNDVLSVAHAMVSLGIDLIHELVGEAVEARPERKPFSGLSGMHRRFCLHGVVVGRIAELLRDIIRVPVGIDLYLAGLVHDVGMLALDSLQPQFYAQSLRPGSEIANQMTAAEMKYIGAGHGSAGAWLAEKMGIPAPYVKIMQFHHEPQQARDFILPVAIIHLADLFAARRGICFGTPDPEAVNPLNSFAWVMIQDQYKPFLEVNVVDFVASFEEELDKTWSAVSALPD